MMMTTTISVSHGVADRDSDKATG